MLDGVDFLRGVREGRPPTVGPRVGVVGAGDTAMDCARSARRVGATAVQVIYRRTVDQMPADREEIHELREEGIEILELARPVGLRVTDGKLTGLTCLRTEYGGVRDAAGRKVAQDVPGSEFEVGLDTLILAISQAPLLDLFGEEQPRLTPDGYLATDPLTLATSIPGVYAAGDVSAHGPASIVRAAADGKRAARAIAESLGIRADLPAGTAAYRLDPGLDVQALTVRRAHREYRVPIRTTSARDRAGFDETVLGYTTEEATREASRCLDCDVLCSLCVGVCPNLAIVTYESEGVRHELPVLEVRGDGVQADGAGGTVERFEVAQRFQVAVLTDLCNECGTCVTACPTAGRPYVDKPRLYLDATDFEAQDDNAYRLLDAGRIEGRFDARDPPPGGRPRIGRGSSHLRGSRPPDHPRPGDLQDPGGGDGRHGGRWAALHRSRRRHGHTAVRHHRLATAPAHAPWRRDTRPGTRPGVSGNGHPATAGTGAPEALREGPRPHQRAAAGDVHQGPRHGRSGTAVPARRAGHARVLAHPALPRRAGAALRRRLVGAARRGPLLPPRYPSGDDDARAVRRGHARGHGLPSSALRQGTDLPHGALLGKLRRHPGGGPPSLPGSTPTSASPRSPTRSSRSDSATSTCSNATGSAATGGMVRRLESVPLPSEGPFAGRVRRGAGQGHAPARRGHHARHAIRRDRAASCLPGRSPSTPCARSWTCGAASASRGGPPCGTRCRPPT